MLRRKNKNGIVGLAEEGVDLVNKWLANIL